MDCFFHYQSNFSGKFDVRLDKYKYAESDILLGCIKRIIFGNKCSSNEDRKKLSMQ